MISPNQALISGAIL